MASLLKQNGPPTGQEQSRKEYCLRWNNHQPNFVNYFGDILNKESMTDVTLISHEGKKVYAHKIILAACSPYFQNAFENHPSKHPLVILKDILYVDLRAIIRFIYNGEVNISQDRIDAVLSTASALQIKGLAEVPPDELKRVSNSSKNIFDSNPNSVQQTDSHNEVPRKKLKSASGGSSKENEHSTGESFESGVGMSRSMDDGESTSPPKNTSSNNSKAQTEQPQSFQSQRREKSFDDIINSEDFPDNQPFDEMNKDDERSRFELEIADVKIEADEDGDDIFEEALTYAPGRGPDNPDLEDYSSIGSSSSFTQHTQPQMSVSKGGRRGRLLKRQNRIKRGDNEGGAGEEIGEFSGESNFTSSSSFSLNRANSFEIYEHERPSSAPNLNLNNPSPQSRSSKDGPVSPKTPQGQESISPPPPPLTRANINRNNFMSKNLPIVITVSQSSPTPPSSPNPLSIDERFDHHHHTPPPLPPISFVSSTPKISYASASTITVTERPIYSTPPPALSPSSSHLTVPAHDSGSCSGTNDGSFGSSSRGHLVKQYSQPLFPTHSPSPHFVSQSSETQMLRIKTEDEVKSSGSGGNPVIRRQYSQPNPTVHQHQPQSQRFVPYKSSPPHPTLYQIMTTSKNEENSRSSSPSGGGGGGGRAYIVDSSPPQILHIVTRESRISSLPPTISSNSMTITKPMNNISLLTTPTFSKSVETITSTENQSSNFSNLSSSSNFEEGSNYQRSDHCPALRHGPALGCNYCWNSVDSCGRILRRKTKYHCPDCHINLCIVPCFQEYHEKVNKKKKAKAKLGLPKPSSM